MNKSISTLRLEDVHPNPKNQRIKLTGVEELAANIKENGQLDPAIVVKDGDIYYLVSGHRRHAALKLLGRMSIEAIVADGWDSAIVAKAIMAANDHVPFNELERSRGIQTMLTLGVSPEAAAASVGETVERMRGAATGLTKAQDYAEDMSLDRLIALAEFEDDDEAAKRLMTCEEAKWRLSLIHI